MYKSKKGVSLIEVLIVVAILAIMIVMLALIVDPRVWVNRGNDSRRRKDLDRIKVAFEDYYAGKKCYPDAALVAEMRDVANCNKAIVGFGELAPWQCDPRGEPYMVVVENSSCPRWFKVYTNLEDPSARGVPSLFKDPNPPFPIGDGSLTTKDANYGVSSANVSWDDLYLAGCTRNCYRKPPGGGANECNLYNMGGCTDNCYADRNCRSECRIPCCGPECDLWDEYIWGYH